MNALRAQTLLKKAREEFEKAAANASLAAKRALTTGNMSRQAKAKFKQARKWSRHIKKLAKKADELSRDAQKSLRKAAEKLQKLERKAARQLKKPGAKADAKAGKSSSSRKSASKPAKTAVRRSIKPRPTAGVGPLRVVPPPIAAHITPSMEASNLESSDVQPAAPPPPHNPAA